MAKRRTKKQKIQAKRQFLYKTSGTSDAPKPKAKKRSSKPVVKRQFQKSTKSPTKLVPRIKNTIHSAKYSDLGSIKLDIIKSLVVTSLIIGIELMLYLAWSK